MCLGHRTRQSEFARGVLRATEGLSNHVRTDPDTCCTSCQIPSCTTASAGHCAPATTSGWWTRSPPTRRPSRCWRRSPRCGDDATTFLYAPPEIQPDRARRRRGGRQRNPERHRARGLRGRPPRGCGCRRAGTADQGRRGRGRHPATGPARPAAEPCFPAAAAGSATTGPAHRRDEQPGDRRAAARRFRDVHAGASRPAALLAADGQDHPARRDEPLPAPEPLPRRRVCPAGRAEP
jgi:hypothetical protein